MPANKVLKFQRNNRSNDTCWTRIESAAVFLRVTASYFKGLDAIAGELKQLEDQANHIQQLNQEIRYHRDYDPSIDADIQLYCRSFKRTLDRIRGPLGHDIWSSMDNRQPH